MKIAPIKVLDKSNYHPCGMIDRRRWQPTSLNLRTLIGADILLVEKWYLAKGAKLIVYFEKDAR